MKFQVLQEELSKALSLTSRFTSTRTQLPVLANLLLEAKKNTLQVSSTNLEVSCLVSVGARVAKEGALTVPSRTVVDIVSNLPTGTISLEAQKEQMKIKSQKFESVISGMNANDFPSIPKSAGKGIVKISKQLFTNALQQTLFAVSIDETRPILTGVLMFSKKNSMYFVSTDGFRLSQKRISIKNLKSFKKIIIPKNILNEIFRIPTEKEEIEFSYKEKDSQVIFDLDDVVLSSKILEGEFPNYENIIPKQTRLKILTDKEEFKRATKLASVFARDSANVVKIGVEKDKLNVFAESKTAGQQKTSLDIKIEKGRVSKAFEIAFNYRFLEDFLNSVEGEHVLIEFSGQNAPGIFTDPKDNTYLHLIMPVKIQG